jgi:glucose/arabinose dehydrogenase
MRREALALGLATAIALLTVAAPAAAQSVQLAPFGGQTFSSPYYVIGDPEDPRRVFVVEGTGTIRLVENGIAKSTPFLTIPEVLPRSDECNDCGLYSMAFAPDYAATGLFYVFYTRDSEVSTEEHYLRIEEFRRSAANPDIANPASRRVVLEIPHLETHFHNGGQLQFGPDGLLYISVGDGGPVQGGDPNGNGQNTETLLGKLLRINPAGTAPTQYSIPADNPFAGPVPGADEIYSYGLRNPWRFSFDRLTGDLTIGDVGYMSWEEIDFVPSGAGRGANFGWNCFEGSTLRSPAPAGCESAPSNHTPPVLEYPNPSMGAAAVTGGYMIRDGALPSLVGRYIYADIYNTFSGELRTAQLSAGGSSGDSGLGVFAPNVVSFGEDDCAHVYVATIGGNVYRLEPTSGTFPCIPQTPPETPPTLTCAGRPATIVGTSQNDVRFGTRRRDVIAGLAGNDTVSGLRRNDVVCGGKGADVLRGGRGEDRLLGQQGKDILRGGGGKDQLSGGVGRDLCIGGAANDKVLRCERGV